MDPKKPDYDKLLTDFKSKNKETRMEILKLLRNHPNNDADEQEELVLAKLVRIFGVNGIEWELFGEDVSLDLFLKASLLNHSCSPNVVLWNTSMSSVETKGKLLRKVVKGEELTICYYNSSFADVNSCLTKEQRKEKLLAQYGFECLCDICKEGNIEDENLRKEFQQMRTNQQLKDEMLKILSQSKFEMGLGKCQQQLEELLAIAKRKEEIAKIVDSYAVFNTTRSLVSGLRLWGQNLSSIKWILKRTTR